MSRNQILLVVVIGVLLVVGIPLTLFLISQQQDPRSRASEVVYPDIATNTIPTPPPAQVQQVCTAPAAPASTQVQYPHVAGDNFDLNQADCGWDPVVDATTYNVTILEVDTGSIIRDDSVPSSTTGVTFPVVQGNTYRCDIEAVSECGSVSAITSDEQICSTEGLVPSPTVAIPDPTSPPVTSAPPPPAPTVQVTPPPTGTTETLIIGGSVAAAVLAMGAALLFW